MALILAPQLISPSGARVSVLIDSYPESEFENAPAIWPAGDGTAVGQSLTLANNTTITSCKFYIKKVSAPTGNATAKLYSIGSGSVGTDAIPGSLLATSDNFDVATLTTSYQVIEFTFSTPYAASAGGVCIVFEYTGGDGSNYINVGQRTSTPTHAGNRATYSGSWSSAAADVIFYLYGYLT